MLWHYAYGKPKDTVEIQGGLDVVQTVRSLIVDTAKAGDEK